MGQMAQGMSIQNKEAAQAEMARVKKLVDELSNSITSFVGDVSELKGVIGNSLETAVVALEDIQKEVNKAVETAATCNKTMANFVDDTDAIVNQHKVQM